MIPALAFAAASAVEVAAMVLMLTNQDMERITGLETPAVIAAVEDAYRGLGRRERSIRRGVG